MELLERFAAGDLEAFETLFRQHQREVYSWIVRIVRDTGIAEDLTVETFLENLSGSTKVQHGCWKLSGLGAAHRQQRRFRPSPAHEERNTDCR